MTLTQTIGAWLAIGSMIACFLLGALRPALSKGAFNVLLCFAAVGGSGAFLLRHDGAFPELAILLGSNVLMYFAGVLDRIKGETWERSRKR